MMNIPPSEAKRLSMWEYGALLDGWNRAHGREDEPDLPDPKVMQAQLDRINSEPRLTH